MSDLTPQQKLWDAAAAGNAAQVRKLAVDPQVDFDARDQQGRTAMNIATQNGHPEVAKTILAIREARYARSLGLDPVGEKEKGWKSLLFCSKRA